MAVYAGSIGSLVALGCASKSGQESARSVSTMTTLGGRVIAQLGQAQRRKWQASINVADQTEIGKLAMMLDALPQPWVWLDSWAQVTNTLTPDQSRFEQAWSSGATVGSLVDLEGGGVAVSLLEASLTGRTFAASCPVVPGVPVTGSVFARPAGTGSSSVQVSFRDAAGALLTTISGTARTLPGSGPLGRLTVTATPPANAATCSLTSTNTAMLAGPALTFTTSAMAWGYGAGCRTVVLPGLSLDVVTAWRQAGGQRASYSFDVIEVG